MVLMTQMLTKRKQDVLLIVEVYEEQELEQRFEYAKAEIERRPPDPLLYQCKLQQE